MNRLRCIVVGLSMGFALVACGWVCVVEDWRGLPAFELEIVNTFSGEDSNPIPVLFKGAAKGWGVMAWTTGFLKEGYGALGGRLVNENPYKYNGELAYSSNVSSTLSEHFEDIELNEKDSMYMGIAMPRGKRYEANEENLTPLYEKLVGAMGVGFSERMEELKEQPFRYLLLVGSGFTVSGLHYHASTQLCQISGRKIVYLMHPRYRDQFNCTEKNGGFAGDCMEKDYLFEKNEGIDILSAELEPGDVLYIPKGWLHDVRSIEPSISIICF